MRLRPIMDKVTLHTALQSTLRHNHTSVEWNKINELIFLELFDVCVFAYTLLSANNH